MLLMWEDQKWVEILGLGMRLQSQLQYAVYIFPFQVHTYYDTKPSWWHCASLIRTKDYRYGGNPITSSSYDHKYQELIIQRILLTLANTIETNSTRTRCMAYSWILVSHSQTAFLKRVNIKEEKAVWLRETKLAYRLSKNQSSSHAKSNSFYCSSL